MNYKDFIKKYDYTYWEDAEEDFNNIWNEALQKALMEVYAELPISVFSNLRMNIKERFEALRKKE